MPITVTHPFVSTISDNPRDLAAGKVTPTRWNLAHSISGSFGANEITNIPAGSVTSTNVQAAINQLASLIPAPGPGTDPLALTKGFSVIASNPTFGDGSDQFLIHSVLYTDASQNNPSFSNTENMILWNQATNGQAIYNIDTRAKITFMNYNIGATYNASGQKFCTNESVTAYGMSDTAIGQQFVQFAGGPVHGDEGTGFRLVCLVNQQPFLNVTTVTSVPAPATINTVTTQVITKSKDIQTVTVADTTGAVIGDWIVVGQTPPFSDFNYEAVQVVNKTATSITGIFRNTHQIGVKVTPALRLFCVATYQMGQDRTLVNLSAPSYSVGTVTGIIGGQFVGTATGWTENMVGGNADNIGAITLADDDYTLPPFDAGANRLRSWYQISSVTDPTHLGMVTMSAAGDLAYRGRGPGTGVYTIRPAVKVLRVVANAGSVTGELICETTTTTWNVGDTVEEVICPYADVNGFYYRLETYTNGGTYRSFFDIRNQGGRMFQQGIFLADDGTNFGTADGDAVAWNVGYWIRSCNYGVRVENCRLGAILLRNGSGSGDGTTDLGSSIVWGAATSRLGADTPNKGFTWDINVNGALNFVGVGGTTNPLTSMEMRWNGWVHMQESPGTVPGRIIIDDRTDLNYVNYDDFFMRWIQDDHFEIGCEGFGTLANGRDLAFLVASTEVFRLRTNSKLVKFNTQCFAANDTVATALTNVGPIGSHTTVQKWLEIKDDTDTTLYIPCF